MDSISITIVGAGNMGGAIATALSENGRYNVSIYDKYIESAKKVAGNRRINIIESFDKISSPDVLLIAVKPQVLPSLYSSLKSIKPKLFISIAAGVSLNTLKENISKEIPIVRYMPNIAAKTKNAVTAIALPSDIDNTNKSIAMDIASSFGSAFELDEKLFPAFIGISGSAIAYVFEFLHQLAMGGVREGIPYNKALEIARDTLISATSIQKETKLGAIELETMVCSAGGTTVEGIKALDEGCFSNTVINAVSAAANKSRELEKRA